MSELLNTSEAPETKYVVVRTSALTSVVVGGKKRNTRSFSTDEGESSVTNWKLKTADGQVLDYVAVFAADAPAFEAQIKGGEEITVLQKYKEKITYNADGHPIREPMAQPELSYDSPLGEAATMFD